MKVRAQIRLQSQTLLLFAASALAPTFTSNKAAYNLNPVEKGGQGNGLDVINTSILVPPFEGSIEVTWLQLFFCL